MVRGISENGPESVCVYIELINLIYETCLWLISISLCVTLYGFYKLLITVLQLYVCM